MFTTAVKFSGGRAPWVHCCLKGVSSLPKVTDVLEKAKSGKSLTASQKLVFNAHSTIRAMAAASGVDLESVESREWLEELVKRTRRDLVQARTRLNTLKLAKLITGDWFPGLQTDDKGNFIYEGADYTLVAKADRVKVYI